MFEREHQTPQHCETSDDRFDHLALVLSKPDRARILSVLTAASEPVTLGELVAELADTDDTDGTTQAPIDIDRSTAMSLYHCDLPKLDHRGLVEWNAEADTATVTSDGAACADLLGL